MVCAASFVCGLRSPFHRAPVPAALQPAGGLDAPVLDILEVGELLELSVPVLHFLIIQAAQPVKAEGFDVQ